ncbi:hypothetical protein JHK85_045891 [Glycine max]|nr:hypothetical protein JHK85_045891 [Glycine max]
MSKSSGDRSVIHFFQNSSWCNRHIFKRLYLSYNRLTGKLPKSIGLLSELEVLTLMCCTLLNIEESIVGCYKCEIFL